MRDPRLWSGFVLALGITIGTFADERPERVVPQLGEFRILSGDFHVHAAPGDGTLLPWELRREAARAGLDVLAITNHNTTFAARFGRWWTENVAGSPPILLVGEEITSPDYHIAAAGIRRTVTRRQSAASAVAEVHAQGGVAIAAHPAREYWAGYDDRALALLDGAEAANGTDPIVRKQFDEFRERARQRNVDIAPIGSSDFHGGPALGRCRTYLLVREQTEAGVLEAIRSGRTVAADAAGNLYGDPELVRLVRARQPAGRSDDRAAWRRLAVGCAWLGIIGMVLFRRTP